MNAPGAIRAGGAIARRDLILVWRRRGDSVQPVMFAIMICLLFPLALGTRPESLQLIAPGVIWVAILLSNVVALDSLFRGDLEDGSLEQLMLSGQPLPVLLFAKTAVHWLTSTLPLLIAVPLLAELLYLPADLLPVLIGSLALGSPLLSLVGSVIMALTVGMRRSGMLLALLALPMYVPILIFGAGSVVAAAQGLPYLGAWWLLAAGLVLGLVLAPIAAALALRIALA